MIAKHNAATLFSSIAYLRFIDMRTLLLTLVVTFLCASSPHVNASATFGLTSGMPISNVSGCETVRAKVPWVYDCKTAQTPSLDMRFQTYLIQYTEKGGICKVTATADFDTRESIESFSKVYSSVRSEFDATHGASVRNLWEFTGEYFRDHRGFVAKYKDGVGLGRDLWTVPDGAPVRKGISSVRASAYARDANQATITVIVEFDNIGTCIPAARKYSVPKPVIKRGEKHFVLAEGKLIGACQMLVGGLNQVMVSRKRPERFPDQGWFETFTVDELLRVNGVTQPPWQVLDPRLHSDFILQLVQRNAVRLVPIVEFLDPELPWLEHAHRGAGWQPPQAWGLLSEGLKAEYSDVILRAHRRFIENGGTMKIFAYRDVHPVVADDVDLGVAQLERPIRPITANSPVPQQLGTKDEGVMTAEVVVSSLTPSSRSRDNIGGRNLLFDGFSVTFQQHWGRISASIGYLGECRFAISGLLN